ncbi:hypothetical protein PN498_26745 [Oscillatoria sp. CS-180]|uniref:hypothetical protein n=1 Tax=Oscillatoria sp. CS-180 TaxID=3021720 RepID=UPI00232B316E|nr:hypothetical protein [Oscillatoria sp. CS-180]MDB9529618.1 hypothetical protein [Oscillatoria sp. CS-180]
MSQEPVDSLSPIALQKAAPGPIALAYKKIQNAPQRLVLGVPIAIAALVGIGLIVASGFRTAEPESVESNVSDYNMVTFDPLALAGIDESTDPAIAAVKMRDILPEYDRWLQLQISKDLDYPIARESERLTEFAKKEAAEGNVELNDPAADIDLKGCLAVLADWECVILRYAGDAVEMYRAGVTEDDPMQMLEGTVRYHAAMRALFPVQYTRTNGTETLQGLTNQRYAVYLLKQMMPSAQLELQKLQAAPATQPGDAANLEEDAN